MGPRLTLLNPGYVCIRHAYIYIYVCVCVCVCVKMFLFPSNGFLSNEFLKILINISVV